MAATIFDRSGKAGFIRALGSRRSPGISAINAVMILVVAVILGFSGYAIFQSVQVQQRIATAYDGWEEGIAGYAKVQEAQQKTGKAAIVYFYAPWCPHCKRFTQEILSQPQVKAALAEYPRVKIYPEEDSQELTLMSAFGATGFPTFYVVQPGGQRLKIDTHAPGHSPRLKTPEEFIESVRIAAEGAAPAKSRAEPPAAE